MTKPLKQKKVKAWAVVPVKEKQNPFGTALVFNLNQACFNHAIYPIEEHAINYAKSMTERMKLKCEVISCTITYHLPTNKKKK